LRAACTYLVSGSARHSGVTKQRSRRQSRPSLSCACSWIV